MRGEEEVKMRGEEVKMRGEEEVKMRGEEVVVKESGEGAKEERSVHKC